MYARLLLKEIAAGGAWGNRSRCLNHKPRGNLTVLYRDSEEVFTPYTTMIPRALSPLVFKAASIGTPKMRLATIEARDRISTVKSRKLAVRAISIEKNLHFENVSALTTMCLLERKVKCSRGLIPNQVPIYTLAELPELGSWWVAENFRPFSWSLKGAARLPLTTVMILQMLSLCHTLTLQLGFSGL